jgi:4-hydroxy-tetrahydrodipicolinate synthase
MTQGFPRGICAAMSTPFGDDGVDTGRARRHAARLVADGAHGVLVAGSGGEFIAMTVDERKTLAEAVIAEVADRAFVNVCVAAYATDVAIELGRHAKAAGADVVMATAPYFMRPHREAVRRHLSAIREVVDLPLMLYNTPATTGVDIPLAEIVRLVDEGVIQALKQSFPDAYHVRDARATLGERAAVYCGHDGSAFEALVIGADGWTSVLPTVCTVRARRLWDGVQANEPLDGLAAQWYEALPFVRLVFEDEARVDGAPHWLEIMKTAVNLIGDDVGAPRAPFGLLAGEDADRLHDLLRELGVLAPAAMAV